MFVFPFPLSRDLLLHHRNIVYSNVLTMMVNGIVFYDIHQTHWLVTASVMQWLAYSPAYLKVNFSIQFKVGCLFFFDLHTPVSLIVHNLWRKNNQGGMCDFCCNYKQHDNGDHDREENEKLETQCQTCLLSQ